VRARRQIEKAMRRRDQPFPKERAADLEHQLVIVLEPELQDALEAAHRPLTVAQLEQGLSETGEPVLVIRVEPQGIVEAPPRPGVFLPGEMGVGLSDMEFDGVRVERDPFLQDGQSFIVAAFVVELMGLFVEFVGAQKCFRHRRASPGRLV
jgi:hypothetical protein